MRIRFIISVTNMSYLEYFISKHLKRVGQKRLNALFQLLYKQKAFSPLQFYKHKNSSVDFSLLSRQIPYLSIYHYLSEVRSLVKWSRETTIQIMFGIMAKQRFAEYQ